MWGRVSRVLFVTIISLGPKTGRTSRKRLLSTSGLGEQPDNGRIGDCCGEDCPFQPESTDRSADREWSLLLSRRSVPIWTVDAEASPRFSPGTLALCSSDFPLAEASDRPSHLILNCQCAGGLPPFLALNAWSEPGAEGEI